MMFPANSTSDVPSKDKMKMMKGQHSRASTPLARFPYEAEDFQQHQFHSENRFPNSGRKSVPIGLMRSNGGAQRNAAALPEAIGRVENWKRLPDSSETLNPADYFSFSLPVADAGANLSAAVASRHNGREHGSLLHEQQQQLSIPFNQQILLADSADQLTLNSPSGGEASIRAAAGLANGRDWSKMTMDIGARQRSTEKVAASERSPILASSSSNRFNQATKPVSQGGVQAFQRIEWLNEPIPLVTGKTALPLLASRESDNRNRLASNNWHPNDYSHSGEVTKVERTTQSSNNGTRTEGQSGEYTPTVVPHSAALLIKYELEDGRILYLDSKHPFTGLNQPIKDTDKIQKRHQQGRSKQRIQLAPKRDSSAGSLHIRSPFLYPDMQVEKEEKKRQRHQKESSTAEVKVERPSEDLATLFQELGFDFNNSISGNLVSAIEEKMAKKTPNWNNSSMQEKFGSRDASQQADERSQIGTNQKKGDKWNTFPRNSTTNARQSKSQIVTKDANESKKIFTGLQTSFTGIGNGEEIDQNENRRSTLPHANRQSDLGNFWLKMLKTRAEASASAAQQLPLGLSAAERLQQLHEPIDRSNSPSSSSDYSSTNQFGSNRIQQLQQQKQSEQQQMQKYPYRKAGIESVAIRRTNYLMEANRAHSPALPASANLSGRSTPLLVVSNPALNSPLSAMVTDSNVNNSWDQKPSSHEQEHLSEKNFAAAGLLAIQEERGCGRFPTGHDDYGKEQQNLLKNGQNTQELLLDIRQKKGRIPDTVGFCSLSTAVGRPVQLPQPAPNHNIQDQLISAGYPVRQSSFFGGAANNPFYGQLQQQRQSTTLRSNSPNFPSTNMVVSSRISELERQKEKSSNAVQQQQAANTERNNLAPPKVAIMNGFVPKGSAAGGQLSPLSSVFKRKPVIVFDFDQQLKKEEREEKQKQQQLLNTAPAGNGYPMRRKSGGGQQKPDFTNLLPTY